MEYPNSEIENKKWGFFSHQYINKLAVFTLPAKMLGFYKHNITYITRNSINPDKRRYAVEGEDIKHYLDADKFGDSAVYHLPRYWKNALEKYPLDTLKKRGIIPWNIQRVKSQLTNAMFIKDGNQILKLSADLGHYIGDINVPLHTTSNYNGQQTQQLGIHNLWESKLTEAFADDYDFFVGKAKYIENTQLYAWDALIQANEAKDSVLTFEKELTSTFGQDKKYTLGTKNSSARLYSKKFLLAYHKKLNGMVERQMRKSIKMTGDFWFTCWIDAGQPNLDKLIDYRLSEKELEEEKKQLEIWRTKIYPARDHE